MLKALKNFILDTLFPVECLGCGVSGVYFCPECLEKTEIITAQICPYCEKTETEAGETCPSCKISFWKKNPAWAGLDNLIVAAKYENVAKLVHVFKYNFVRDLGAPLADLLIAAIIKNNLPLPDLIVPVPLHPRRERWRGFNQAGILADNISENLSPSFPIPIFKNLIIRKKYTAPQMKIKSYQERKKNLENAFFPASSSSISLTLTGKRVLLVDDIATTGSTLFECARILKQNGAQKVFAVVIARQEIHP